MTETDSPLDRRDTPPPRLWPAVVIVATYWALLAVVSNFSENNFVVFLTRFWGPLGTGVLFLVWWWALSRLSWTEKLIGFLAFLGTAGLAFIFVHPMMKMGFTMYALPVALTAWLAWIVVSRKSNLIVRHLGLIVVLLLAWGYYDLLRLDGVWGDMDASFSWRWTPTAEDVFLAKRPPPSAPKSDPSSELDAQTAETLSLSDGDWPEFRGPLRDGRLLGVKIDTDWASHPPKQIWQQRIGPGWSSFAIIGELLFTQEQRADDEAVVCYEASSGKELWAHFDKTRFTEIVAGAGPRATPTFHDGRLYSLGANGNLNCLDPTTGKAHWSADIVADSGAKVPMWGFSSSPLVIDGKAIVFAGGPEGKAVLAYHVEDGMLAWSTGDGTHSYSSPHTMLVDEKPQVVVMSDIGLAAYDPSDGKILWKHDWPMEGMARIVQPHLLGGSRVVVGSGLKGTRLLTVSHKNDAWAAEEGWTSNDLKPDFNDFVSRDGFAYGFDGSVFCAIDLKTGKRKWKQGRYGKGQVLLLADQGVLLVLGEKGECVLVEANPEKLVELGRFQAIEGKTWNHPVIAHGKLFVRNGELMACYELTHSNPKAPAGGI